MSDRGPVSGSLRWYFQSSLRKRRRGQVLLDAPLPIYWGRRSRRDGRAWNCQCGFRNQPSRHLFVKLPAFKCRRCNARVRIDFRFSFGNLAANDTWPIGEIYNQDDTDDCLLHALAKAAEITDRIRAVLSGNNDEIPSLDPYSLEDTYRDSRMAEGIPEDKINYKDDAAMYKMIELMQTIGVQDEPRDHTCRIGGMRLVTGDFEKIAVQLAKGYPLVVDIVPGGNFKGLRYRQIYKCPFNNSNIDGRRVTIHTVVLVGAARWGAIDYFYFVNSWGDWWCFRVNRADDKDNMAAEDDEDDGIGGIGKMMAEDIISVPIKFLRYPRQ